MHVELNDIPSRREVVLSADEVLDPLLHRRVWIAKRGGPGACDEWRGNRAEASTEIATRARVRRLSDRKPLWPVGLCRPQHKRHNALFQ